MREKEDFRNYYEIRKRIKEEGYGAIYEAENKETKELRTLKIFDKNRIRENFMQENFRQPSDEEMKPYNDSFYNEMQNMKTLEGKNKENINAIKIYEYFDTINEFVIVMEFCDENLLNIFVSKKEPYNSKEIYDILIQLNNTFKIMEKNKMVIGELKLENILIKYENVEKTKYIYKLKLENNCQLINDISNVYTINSIVGNPKAIAPEILNGEVYNEKSDLWSLGVIIYILFHKQYPFTSNNAISILDEIKQKGNSLFIKNDNSKLDDLIRKLLVEDPNKRLSWNDYFHHPFFQRNLDNTLDTIIIKNEDYKKYYDIEQRIASGTFGVVYKAKKKDTNEKRAIKIFDKERIRINIRNEFFREPTEEEMISYTNSLINEIENMKIVQSKNKGFENNNTVKFYECFNTNEDFAIVMELCDDNLTNLLTKRKQPYNIEEIKGILIQLNNSFKIMAENKLVHRDLKLQNILVKYEDKGKTILKLTDYGLSKKLLSISKKFSSLAGTANFMAPEIMKSQKYNEECDLWSLGVIIHILCFKNYPYKGEGENDILKEIKKINKDSLKKTGNSDLDDLLSRLLVEDPKERITWKEYFNHPFFIQKPFKDKNNENQKENIIIIKLKISKQNINKDIFFFEEDNQEHAHVNELNETNCKLYINNEQKKFSRSFKTSNDGEYEIKIIFKKNLNNCSYMFNKCKNIISIDLSSFDSSKVTDMNHMFSDCYNVKNIILTNLNTENVINMSYMFNKCYELVKICLPKSFNTKNCNNMSFMFNNCQIISEINFSSSFVTNKVINMRSMFGKCFNIPKLDLQNFETEQVTDMSYMFEQCNSLYEILINPSSFKTKNVTHMNYMFSECTSLKAINLSSFNTEKVKYMSYMFNNSKALTEIDLSKSKINEETNLTYMFNDCSNLRQLNISSFKITRKNKIENMFNDLTNIKSIIVERSSIEIYKNMFKELKNKILCN